MSINLLNYPEKMKEINNCIYIYTDTRNGMQYVGQAKNLYIRNGQHARRSGNTMFDNIYSAHKEHFTLSIIEKFDECTNVCDVLNNTEIYYIAALNTKHPNGYNLTSGGEGVNEYQWTEEQKENQSKIMKNYFQTEAGKNQIQMLKEKFIAQGTFAGENNPMYGVHRYGESNPFYGKTHTEKSKKQMSESHKGKQTGENNPMYGVHRYGKDNPNAKAVICHTGETFNTIEEAKLFCNSTKVGYCSNGNRKTAGKHPITGEKLKWYKLDSEEGQEIYKQFYED